MDNNWIPLQKIPADESVCRVNDQSFWRKLLDEFKLSLRIVDPVEATVNILPQSEGVLFRGNIRGRIAMPCDRCSGDSMISLHASFDSFESFPSEALSVKTVSAQLPREMEAEERDDAVIRMAANGRGIEINPAALAWEEFSLALPIRPLCSQHCKGLCPSCGCNKNTETCSCDANGNDPRLSVLQGLIIQRK
jgi:uncharacterized protein